MAEEQKPASAEATAGKKDVAVPEKFKSLVEQIEKMSVLDLAELVKILEDKFGVSAAAPVAMMAGAAVAAPAEEKDSFDVELTAIGTDKIGAIKVVRELTQLGLKEAKDLVEGAPKKVKEGAKKEDAENMKKKLEAVGCKVALK